MILACIGKGALTLISIVVGTLQVARAIALEARRLVSGLHPCVALRATIGMMNLVSDRLCTVLASGLRR